MCALLRLTVTVIFDLQVSQVRHRLDAHFTLHWVVLDALQGSGGFDWVSLEVRKTITYVCGGHSQRPYCPRTSSSPVSPDSCRDFFFNLFSFLTKPTFNVTAQFIGDLLRSPGENFNHIIDDVNLVSFFCWNSDFWVSWWKGLSCWLLKNKDLKWIMSHFVTSFVGPIPKSYMWSRRRRFWKPKAGGFS